VRAGLLAPGTVVNAATQMHRSFPKIAYNHRIRTRLEFTTAYLALNPHTAPLFNF